MQEETWKVSDIAGSRVETEEGEFIGVLTDVFGTAAHDIFVVKSGESEVLLPGTKSVVIKISLSEKKITVRMPKGLLDIYGPKTPA